MVHFNNFIDADVVYVRHLSPAALLPLLPPPVLSAYVGGGACGSPAVRFAGAGDMTAATCDAKAAAFFLEEPQSSLVPDTSFDQPSVMVAPVCASLLIHFGKGFPTSNSHSSDAKWLQFRFNKLYERAGQPCLALINISTSSSFVRWHTPMSTRSRKLAPTNVSGNCFGSCGLQNAMTSCRRAHVSRKPAAPGGH